MWVEAVCDRACHLHSITLSQHLAKKNMAPHVHFICVRKQSEDGLEIIRQEIRYLKSVDTFLTCILASEKSAAEAGYTLRGELQFLQWPLEAIPNA